MTQINLTSLLDIVFVLLLTFMVVARATQYQVDLELPTVREAPTSSNVKPVNLSLSFSDGNTVFKVNSQPSSLDNFIGDLNAAGVNEDSTRPVTISADRRVPWEDMADVISELKSAGITSVGLMTDVER